MEEEEEEKKPRKKRHVGRPMLRRYQRKIQKQRIPAKNKMPKHTLQEKASTYLKYIRVIRKYIQKKYDIGLSELELALYLYDEDIFDKKTFNSYACTLGFTSLDLFSRLKEKGLIEKWRDEYGFKRLYTLTFKYKYMCRMFYKHLEGEPVPENVNNNPLFRKTGTFSDKMYARLIRQMNKARDIRKQEGES